MRAPRRTSLRPHAPLAALLLILLCMLAAAPSTYAAAEYAAPESYAGTCAANTHNGGGRDASGRLYMACAGASVLIVERDGTSRKVAISHGVDRVAPSPDGAYLYSIGASARRFNRQANGSYVLDTAFRFQLPPLYAQQRWPLCGGGVATDGYGDIYLSTGGWCTTANMILKFAPDGTYLTGFGDYGVSAQWTFRVDGVGAVCTPGPANCKQVLVRNDVGANPGKFQVNMMIAVTADGSRIWVADNNNMRVQWFDRIGGATYVFGGMWSGEGAMHPDAVGSTYGIAVDPWGYAYVATTTRCQVWRLDPNGTNPVLVAAPACNARDHVLAVDALGRVWVGEWALRIRRLSALPGVFPVLPPKPPIDRTDPILTSITAPTETIDSGVTVTINATDDVAITEMRFADESGNPGPWMPYAATSRVELSPNLGWKVISVQVRDGRRGESVMLSHKLLRKPIPDVTAPTLTVTAPASTTVPSVTLAIDSADAIGVTHLRIAGADGEFGPWLAWSGGRRDLERQLGAAHGIYAISIRVRDASWNESDIVTVRVTFAPPPPPVVVQATQPTQPTPTVPGASPIVIGGGTGSPIVVRDTLAPKLRTVRVPARSCSRLITIRLASTDDRGAYWLRIANEDGRYGKWQRYRGTVRHALSRGTTRKLVTVQVADAAGNISAAVSRRTIVVRCGR